MKVFRRYLKLYLFTLSRYAMMEMAYRVNFLTSVLHSASSFGATLVFLEVLYFRVETLAGWSKYELLLLLGVYLLMRGILDASIRKGLDRLPRFIQRGQLDNFLLKPLNSIYAVVTGKLDFDDVFNVLLSFLVINVALRQLSTPSLFNWSAFALMFTCGLVILLADYLLIMTLSFWVTQFNQQEIYKNFIQMTRIPTNIFSKRAQFIFTYLIPLAFLVLFPSQALLGKLPTFFLFFAPFFAAFNFWLSVKFWHKGLRRYQSASS